MTNKKKTTEQFILESKKKHNNKYDYSKSNYINAYAPITITCPNHGDFTSSARNHYYKGYGCKKCGYSNPHNKLSTEDFIQKSLLIHGDKYDYSKVEYKQTHQFITIICKKHGDFKQRPISHLQGCGCKKCSSSTAEKLIQKLLTNANIEFIHQHSFQNCMNPKTGRKLKFDFYIPKMNLCLEFDGKQHFLPVKGWGGNKTLEKTQYRDSVKTDYCKNNNISLLRINYLQNVEKEIELLISIST